jgi:hypothetical protein
VFHLHNGERDCRAVSVKYYDVCPLRRVPTESDGILDRQPSQRIAVALRQSPDPKLPNCFLGLRDDVFPSHRAVKVESPVFVDKRCLEFGKLLDIEGS